MVDVLLLLLGVLLILIGLIGCVLPVIPGPPLSFLGLISLQYTKWGGFESDFLWTFGLIAVVVTVLDYIVPIWGTKKFGGSKSGVWGATVGLLSGLFIGPVGVIFGPFVGAFIGEYIVNREEKRAFIAALGSFIGLLTGIVLKLIASGVIAFYFVKQIITMFY